MKPSIVILAGGGPAPGINTVIGTIAKTFISKGYRVIGLHEGYKGLFNGKPSYIDIDFFLADDIFNRGGSHLMMSRYKPSDEDFEKRFDLNFFRDNNVKLLVTIGGDDTASTANRVTKYLGSHSISIQNIHVPKTIDNDLPLPNNQPTFGYQSAKSEGTRVATIVYEDARTSGTWFLVSAMGRSAGHLAIGIGASCHYPMIVIPEMFNKTELTIDKIVRLAVSSIIKRKLMGISYGGVIVSEGVFYQLSNEELVSTGVQFSYDEHGHPELGKISKAQLFSTVLDAKLESLGLKVLPYSRIVRHHLLLADGLRCMEALQGRRDRLHGVYQLSGHRDPLVPEGPAGSGDRKDSSASGGHIQGKSAECTQVYASLSDTLRL